MNGPATARPLLLPAARLRHVTAWLALLALCSHTMARAVPCPRSELPAATLLFPYFEVDLNGGRTTLLAVAAVDAVGGPGIIVRATLWTNWAIPTASWDFYLRSASVQTINLRDIFTTGTVPVTHPPTDRFPTCSPNLGGTIASAADLRAKHNGVGIGDFCYGRRTADNEAVGYVTFDVVTRCSPASMNPTKYGYFRGLSPVAATDPSHSNFLWGDFTLLDPDNNFASGQNAVLIHTDARFTPRSYTFYGRYVNFSGADKRMPLPSIWSARYMIGPPFADTRLLVWRDTLNSIPAPVRCGNRPPWFPLLPGFVTARNEAGLLQPPELLPSEVFPDATQVTVVTAWDGPVEAGHPTRIVPVSPFGVLTLNLDHFETDAQGWVGWVARADNRFSTGVTAAPLYETCPTPP